MDLAITIFNILTALSLPISTCLQEGIESADCLGHSVTFLIIYTVVCACYVYRYNRLVLQRFAFEPDLVDDFDWREVARVLVSIAVYFIISALIDITTSQMRMMLIASIEYLLLIGWLPVLLLSIAVWAGLPLFTLLGIICRPVLTTFRTVFEAVVLNVARFLQVCVRFLMWVNDNIISFEDMTIVIQSIASTFVLAVLVSHIYENASREAGPMPP